MSVPKCLRFCAFVFALLVCFGAFGQESAYADPLTFFKNYFVTGDYVAGGAGLLGKGVSNPAAKALTGGVSTYATGTIHMSGVPGYLSNTSPQIPQHADIVAAYLYWETLANSYADPTQLAKGTFRNMEVVGTQIAGPRAQACGAFGLLANVGAAQTQFVFRADVLRYLPYSTNPITGMPTSQRLVNDTDLASANLAPHTVSLPDSGASWILSTIGHKPAFLTQGASLIVVYRVSGAPLKSVVIYNGAFSLSSQTPQMSQTIQGFYQASNPTVAKMTQVVGDGFSIFKEQLTVNGFVPAGVSPTTPFKSLIQGNSWTTLTFDVSSLNVAGSSSLLTTVAPLSPAGTDCLSWSAMAVSTNVQASDGDGLLDVWKSANPPIDPNGHTLANLNAMGARTGQKDVFVEIDYMNTNGYVNAVQSVPAHSHLPTQAALDMVGSALKAKGISVHFDVGNNYQLAPDQFIIPANFAEGGKAVQETICASNAGSPACPPPSGLLFSNYPGTVSWKNGFQIIKNGNPTLQLPAHFDDLRKDMFHYAFFAHALALPKWRTVDKTLTSIVVANNIATVTTELAHGLTNGAPIFVLGASANSNLNGSYMATSTGLTTFTFPVPAKVVAGTYTNWGLAVSNGTPRSNSGVSDVGGGDLMITLGLWDNNVGTDFMQASTLFHEMGHNFDLGHGGDISDAINCKPNYQSSMSYMFQVQGLLSQDGARHLDYSGTTLNSITENSLNEATGLVGPAYLPRWYAPYVNTNGQYGSAASKHCDGTPILNNSQMVRVDDPTAVAAPLDWDLSGSANSVDLQDINYDGVISTTPFQGFNDWMYLNLQQVGARRGAASYSDDVSPSQDMGDDLGIAGGDLGIAGGDLGIAGGDLGIAGGDLGIAGGDLGIAGGDLGIAGGDLGTAEGEVDYETAKAVPSAPTGLTATPLIDSVGFNWAAPSVGAVSSYNVMRALCPSGDCTQVASGSFVPVTTSSCQNSPIFNFCDNFSAPAAADDGLYLYFVTATFNNGNNPPTTSGPTNRVMGSELNVQAMAAYTPTGLGASSILNGVQLTWTAPTAAIPNSYTIWRATCSGNSANNQSTCNLANPNGQPATFSVSVASACSGTTCTYPDNLLASSSDDDATYIYFVTATFGDDTSAQSNSVTGSESQENDID